MQYLHALVAANPWAAFVFAAMSIIGLGLLARWTDQMVNRGRIAVKTARR